MRGGKRKGAGRPPGTYSDRKNWVKVGYRISPESKKIIDQTAKKALKTKGKILDEIIKSNIF